MPRYRVFFEDISVSAAQDLLEIKGATGKMALVKRACVACTEQSPTQQQLKLRGRLLPATVTSGNGTAVTPQKIDPGDADSGFTALRNSTSPASTSGSAIKTHEFGANIFDGLDEWLPSPVPVGPSQSWVLELIGAPTASHKFSGFVEVEEISTSSYIPEVAQFFARIADPGAARKALYNTLIASLVTAGVWAKLDALYLFAADISATALTNLKQSAYGATAVNSPTFTTDQGFTGAASKYIDTNFNPTTASSPNYTQNSCFACVWSLSAAARAGGAFGVLATPNTNYIFPRYSDNNYYLQAQHTADKSGASSDGSGLWGWTRTASNAADYFRNNSSLGSASTASASLTNAKFSFLTTYPTQDWLSEVAAAGAFGGGLTTQNWTDLYNALHAYLQAVAGVP